MRPAFRAPSSTEGEDENQNSGAMRREIAKVRVHVGVDGASAKHFL